MNPNHPWSLCRFGLLEKDQGDAAAAVDLMRRGLAVFGPRLEDPLAKACSDALRILEPTWNFEGTSP